MKIFKNFLFVSALTVAFVSCSDDDDNNGGGDGRDGSISSQNDPDLISTALQGNVTGDITLDAATDWTLSGALAVKDGATLTIEPGTTIRAEAGGTDVYIAVEQGARIEARGTASNPIIMTSAAATPQPGNWGGLVIAGRAPINVGNTALAEVISLRYGGDNANDNSGTLTYVKVEYTGARIGGEQEFNGITFYGVGSETSVNHIAAFFGFDDGIEWFGGTVNVQNAIVVDCRDDWFDWAEGWTGNNSNFYGIRTANFLDRSDDPRGIEGDSNGSDVDASPRSNPTIDGITLVNATPNQEETANGQTEILPGVADLIKIRRGSSATITNGLIALIGEGTAGDVVDLNDDGGPGVSSTSITANVFNADATDINNPDNATINLTTVTTAEGGADTSVFAWTGFSFPAIELPAPAN